jgi:hypothetical protein
MTDSMPTTTIQVDEKTRQALLRYASRMQARLGRKVTFDEAIRLLMDDAKETGEASRQLERLFGSMAGENGLWDELEAERKGERARVERKA